VGQAVTAAMLGRRAQVAGIGLYSPLDIPGCVAWFDSRDIEGSATSWTNRGSGADASAGNGSIEPDPGNSHYWGDGLLVYSGPTDWLTWDGMVGALAVGSGHTVIWFGEAASEVNPRAFAAGWRGGDTTLTTSTVQATPGDRRALVSTTSSLGSGTVSSSAYVGTEATAVGNRIATAVSCSVNGYVDLWTIGDAEWSRIDPYGAGPLDYGMTSGSILGDGSLTYPALDGYTRALLVYSHQLDTSQLRALARHFGVIG